MRAVSTLSNNILTSSRNTVDRQILFPIKDAYRSPTQISLGIRHLSLNIDVIHLYYNNHFIYLFQKVEEPFLQAAKTTLGDRYTPNIENLYKLTIKFILENLVKGYEEGPVKSENPQT